MKKILSTLAVAGCSLWMVGTLHANPITVTIDDKSGSPQAYWGGEGKDVIEFPDGSRYELTDMVVTVDGSLLKVVIHDTNEEHGYFSEAILTDPLGDLFLSTNGWSPYGDAPHYNDDSFTKGTDWEYVVVLDDKEDGKGTTSLYSTSSATDPYYVMGKDVGRKWQVASFNPLDITALNDPKDSADWWELTDENENDYYDTLTITIKLPGSFDWNGQKLGLHWTMACANDVIEGQFNAVPEPTTLLLFGTGLASLAAVGRRRIRK